MKKLGALEAGGTKMVLGVFDEDGNELIRRMLPTESPETVLPIMKAFFDEQNVDALGIGSFGPLDLNPESGTYGNITTTPKPGWRDIPLLRELSGNGSIPALIDTDVNAAALAEVEMGAARGCRSAVYVTIGTGIGAGIILDGKPVHGLSHPEVGHMLIRPDAKDPIPHGVCPYHDGCLEGLAAGPALGKRAGTDASALPDDHPVFEMEADYLAQMCMNLILTVSPEKIILGGGVMGRKALLDAVRSKTVEKLGGYVQLPCITEKMDEYIVLPELYPVSGLIGSWLLAKQALREAESN